ncbi:MAG: hypothetical protein V8T10_09055 [Merdibacter sp.]
MRNKFIFALFMSIFVLIAGGCSPADNTHAMRMNYQSEWYTDEDFETATEMMIEKLKELIRIVRSSGLRMLVTRHLNITRTSLWMKKRKRTIRNKACIFSFILKRSVR